MIDLIKKYLSLDYPYRSMLIFLGKTVLFFFIINYFFVAYTGMTVEGGKFYSHALTEHADFISAFRRFLLWGGAQFATLIGYPSGYTDFTMFVYGKSGVRMVYSCMGFGLMSACAALILAWPAPWKNRFVSLFVGLVTIILLNMIRIGGLAVLFSNGHHQLFNYISHHDLFNIIVVVIIFLFFTLHIQMATRSEQVDKQ